MAFLTIALVALVAAPIADPTVEPQSPTPSSVLSPAPWGYDGHRIVCEIAYRNLTPSTREAVDELLVGDPDEKYRDFRESCLGRRDSKPARGQV